MSKAWRGGTTRAWSKRRARVLADISETKCAPRPGASQSGLIPEREQTLSKINNRRRR